VRLRVFFKTLLRRLFLLPAFCRDCGRDVHDFRAPDEAWRAAWGPGGGGILCYDCFCERLRYSGQPEVWRLVRPDRLKPWERKSCDSN